MIVEEISEIQIKKKETSSLSYVEWDNLPFGKVFSDHMLMMDYKDGQWNNPIVKPYGEITMSPAISALHYGQSCFEGMKAHRNQQGEIILFRPYENAKRLNVSAERMCMPTVPEEFFIEALKTLLDVDRGWVPDKDGFSLYIRPFLIATDPYVGIRPSETYKFMIFTCPVGAYYNHAIPVKIETHYTRAVKGGTGFAKAAGNYAAALYPAKLAQDEGYRQLIWTDALEHKYIEEAGTMNVMFMIDNKLLTPASSDTILSGLTRDSVVIIAKDWGIEVEERQISVQEIITAFENRTIKEAFGVGTAATIAPISCINYEGQDYFLPEIDNESKFSTKVLSYINKYKRDLIEDKFNWLIKI